MYEFSKISDIVLRLPDSSTKECRNYMNREVFTFCKTCTVRMCQLTVCPGVELELVRHRRPAEAVPGLDLRLVHRVRHQRVKDVGLVVLEALGPHAADDDVVVRVEDVLGGVVLKRIIIIKNMFRIEVSLRNKI